MAIKPPLGPLSVLCVVVVTTWQNGIGLFKKPVAISPLGCDISANKKAPQESAISLNFLKSISLE